MTIGLAKNQKLTLIVLTVSTVILALTWCANDRYHFFGDFNLEPYVTGCASLVPIFSLWWPRPRKNRSSRMSGTVEINLNASNEMKIGKDEAEFQPYFSENSSTSVHIITRFNPDLLGSAVLPKYVNAFKEVRDATAFEISDNDKSPDVNDIILMKNRYGNYALLKIRKLTKDNYNSSGSEFKVDYVINPDKGIDFS